MKVRTSVMMAFLLAFALPLASQAQWRLGTHAGYDVDIKDFLIGVNAQFTIPGAAISGVPLQFSPGFDFYPGVGKFETVTHTGTLTLGEISFPFPLRPSTRPARSTFAHGRHRGNPRE